MSSTNWEPPTDLEPQMNEFREGASIQGQGASKPLQLATCPLILAPLLLFILTGCGAMRNVGEIMTGNTPEKNAKMMEDPSSADQRREGMVYLADHEFGRNPPYTTRHQQIAAKDPDPLVRATAVRSLNISRDKTATKVFIKALSDPSPLVRLEGAKALYRLPDPEAVDKLLALTKSADENKDIRIAAAEALQHYKRLDVGRTLIGLLNTKDFALAWQARRTLKRLTGKDLNYNESAWLDLITGPSKPLG